VRIVIPGGSGHLGGLLALHFHSKGDAVTVLSRNPRPAPWETIAWDGRTHGPWTRSIDGSDVVINLAGRSVDCRYHAANRQEIMASRVDATRAVGGAIIAASRAPRLWMNASTATVYRHALDRDMDEASGELGGAEADAPFTWRFSIDVAKAWEQAFFEKEAIGTRRVALRSAMVMSKERGGVFDVLTKLARTGLGGAAGSGSQFVSWIHEQDFLRAIDFLIERTELEGCVNVASPHPIPNRDFMRHLRAAARIPFGLPSRGWMLEIGAFLLRTETELILKSRRVVPGRLVQAGFDFHYPFWSDAVTHLMHNYA